MRTKTTLILFAVVVAVACWIIFYEKDRPNTDEANRRGQNVVNFDRDELEGLVIHNGDDKIELRRKDDKWRVETPIKDQADRSIVDGLLSDLESWEKDSTISEKEIEADKNALAEFDLAKPKLRLKLLGKGMPPEILFGKDAALEGKMYVRFENSKETYLVRQNVRTAIGKKPEEFRDRKLTELATAQVTRVVLKTPAGEMELQKQGEAWEIVKPLRARADNQKVADVIAQVTSARISSSSPTIAGTCSRMDSRSRAARSRSLPPTRRKARCCKSAAPPEKEQDQVYVRFAPRGFVYALPKKIEEILNSRPADLRDRNLARIDTDKLDRITIDAPGKGKTVLARKDQAWTIASLNNQAANSAEVTRLLDTLQNEQVTRFVEDVASDLPKYGLDQPQLQVTFSSFASENTAESQAGEQPFVTVSFGKVEGEEVYARIGEEPFIVAVRRQLLEQILADPAQWQEVAIFKFKPEEVHRLTSAGEGSEVTITRGANNVWARAEGTGPINETNVQSLLNTLTKLRAVRWIGGAMPPQAFDKVQVTLTFTTSPDDKTVHKLTVGGPAGEGMWYARVEGRNGIFILSNPDFNALRLPLVESAPAPASPSPTPAAP
jgi:hypothetical protein